METPKRPRLIGLREVAATVGLSRATIYRYVRHSNPQLRFPAPVRVGARNLWLEEGVQDWIAQQVAASSAA